MALAIPFLQQSVCALAEKTSPTVGETAGCPRQKRMSTHSSHSITTKEDTPLAALLPTLDRQSWTPYPNSMLVRELAGGTPVWNKQCPTVPTQLQQQQQLQVSQWARTPAASTLPIPGPLHWGPDPHPFQASEAVAAAVPAGSSAMQGLL